MSRTRTYQIHTLRHCESGREFKVREEDSGKLAAAAGDDETFMWSDQLENAVRAALDGDHSDYEVLRSAVGLTIAPS